MKTYFKDLVYVTKMNGEFNRKYWKENLLLGFVIAGISMTPAFISAYKENKRLENLDEELETTVEEEVKCEESEDQE